MKTICNTQSAVFKCTAPCLRVLAVLALCPAVGFAAPSPVFEWTLHRNHISEEIRLKAVKGPEGVLEKPASFDADERFLFADSQYITFAEESARGLPEEGFTVEAYVRVDQSRKWGCILGFSQDNGSYERGWLLGYNGNRFTFKVSSGGSLQAATASNAFEPGSWYHLVATYDQEKVTLYVNGKLNQTTPLSGPMVLPDIPTPFVMGAYKDKDELYPMKGAIAFARIYPGQLSEADIKKSGAASDQSIPFAVYPRVTFPAQGKALVQWQSTQPGKGMVVYGTGKTLDQIARSQTSESEHAILLEDLNPKTSYRYRVVMETAKGKRQLCDIQTLETAMNFSPIPAAVPAEIDPSIREYAETALSAAPDVAGYVLILGMNDGSLAAEIAGTSKLHVIAADTDIQKVSAARQRFYKEGSLGHRISVLHIKKPSKLPWASCMADIILTEVAKPPVAASEVARLQRPKGGVVLLPNVPSIKQWSGVALKLKPTGKYLGATRGDLEGSTDWTHQYGHSNNTTFTDEALGGIDDAGDLSLQWIGHPGGDFGIDRNPRMPAPLSAKGRLFHQGLNRAIALNAYNGAVLWSMEIPNLRRVNIPQDCSNWTTDGDHLYVAIHERAWVVDAKTGALKNTLRLPIHQREDHDWGYIAQHGEYIIGSSVKKDGAYQGFWSGASWYDGVGDQNSIAKVCSDALFGYRKADAKGIWAYEEGLIINSTIAVHDGKIYFLENHDAELRQTFTGRTPDRRLWLDLKTVCLDAATGKVIWKNPAPPLKHLTADQGFVQVAYGLYTKNGYLTMLSEGRVSDGKTTKQGDFQLTLYDGRGGRKWHSTFPWRANHHGAHIAHPVATADAIYMDPHIISLSTGKSDGRFGPRGGCPTVVAYRSALIFRTMNANGQGWGPLGLWSLDKEEVSRIDRLRPSCWLNFLPTQGMLLVPEGGGGCSCGGWIETSVGFLPSLSDH